MVPPEGADADRAAQAVLRGADQDAGGPDEQIDLALRGAVGHRDLAPGGGGGLSGHGRRGDVVEAEEPGDERGGGALPDVQRAALLRDPAAPHHDDLIGERERLALVVRDGQHGRAQLLEERAQLDDEPFAEAAVELAERLVQHQELRARGEGPGQGDALLLAAGQRGDGAAFGPGQTDQLQQFVDPVLGLGPSCAVHPEPEGDIGADITVREELVVLEHQPEPAPVDRDARLVPARQQDPAAVHGLESGDGPEQGGLPAAAGTEQADDPVVGDLQVHRVQRRPPAEPYGGCLQAQHVVQNSPDRSVRIRSRSSSDTAHTSIRIVLRAIACP
ncbi:hypothetical protein EES46_12745 [Streptomyces sp. ADI98-10]|nr:hypothetical protein EES46_12745 [Streptomyces sp. ADI98-10]